MNGFDPARDRIAESELLPLDRYMLARTRDLAEKILAWYEAFEFHRVYQAVNEFAIVDLERLLSRRAQRSHVHLRANEPGAAVPRKRSFRRITEALVRLVAPILTFTADEIWEHLLLLVEGRPISVHLALFPEAGGCLLRGSCACSRRMSGQIVFKIRDEALADLELDRIRDK